MNKQLLVQGGQRYAREIHVDSEPMEDNPLPL